MDRKDLYWLAGLLEGEGSFQKPAPCEPKYPRITLQMTDADVVQRVATLFGRNRICSFKSKRANHKDSYSILVKGKRAVQIMGDLYPLMGERRKQQIRNAAGDIQIVEYRSNDVDWFYWLAGLLEGEGSFMQGTPSKPRVPRIHLKMTDLDIIERAAGILQVKYFGPYQGYRKNPASTAKPCYIVWSTGKRAIDVMKQLRPLMGQRRQSQIDAVIGSYAPRPHPFGDTHPQAKLSTEIVRDIKRRLAEGAKLSHLAAEYGVDTGLIWQIKAERIWQHVT